MYVKAKNEFNYGGIIEMKYGEYRNIDNELAKKLIDLDLVVKNVVTHKKIQFKDGSKTRSNKDA